MTTEHRAESDTLTCLPNLPRPPRPAVTIMPRLLTARPGVAYPRLFGDEPCRRDDINPEVFFPHGSDLLDRTATAKQLCGSCRPATRAECRAWALANPDLAGEAIWAGLTAAERRAETNRPAKRRKTRR